MKEFIKKFLLILIYTLIIGIIYIFITTKGTLNIILKEFNNLNLVYFYLFIFIYIVGVIIIIITDMSKSNEKSDLKKLKLIIPKEDEYKTILNDENKEIYFRTPLFKKNEQRHYISDKFGNLLYKIKLTKTLPHIFTIYDPFNNEIGNIECDIYDLLTNKLIVNINKNKFEIEKKISTKDFLHSDWILTNLPYKVSFKDNKTIIKESRKEIAYIESFKKNIDASLLNYDIFINDKTKLIEISILTLSLILGNPIYKRMMLEGEV